MCSEMADTADEPEEELTEEIEPEHNDVCTSVLRLLPRLELISSRGLMVIQHMEHQGMRFTSSLRNGY